ncbi:MAG: hypothetical protein ABJC07_03160 [Acidobacteriota bacterium]
MIFTHAVLPRLFFAAATASSSSVPLICRLDALTASERERHRLLSDTLQRAAVATTELPAGYDITLDLTRIPGGAARSRPVVQLADWVDLELRCCPFLEFEIRISGQGERASLRLTGGDNVKAFLQTEFPLLSRR